MAKNLLTIRPKLNDVEINAVVVLMRYWAKPQYPEVDLHTVWLCPSKALLAAIVEYEKSPYPKDTPLFIKIRRLINGCETGTDTTQEGI